ncbi:MAG TPA: prepilin-type N-terminal cleavage/methylation domain-containing protein [Verrucomicrobiota bacterium]|nr:prepilin-type N-terminal cleavage/methylation domain-containing protein [Verrucomicrobiota bacterium]HNU50545.1 prepilin-type N-terminal cleavage/methylation domain-containing protein [Verrucomicrobiota bacterium]
MRFKAIHRPESGASGGPRAGFTLVEVLAAMVFLAILLPVAVEGLRVASRAGMVSERKGVAARVAERVLNEYVVTRDTQRMANTGTVQEGALTYLWSVEENTWSEDSMTEVTVEVRFGVQGLEHTVQLVTLVDSSTS